MNWNELNLLARSYIDFQQTRVALELRCQRLEESELVREGLYEVIEKHSIDQKTGKEITSRKIIPLEENGLDEDELKIRTKEVIARMQSHDAYRILAAHKLQLHKQEKQLIKDSKSLFESLDLWKWCLNTKGLGEVAAMTFTGFMNPDRFENIGKVWSYAGLVPNRRMAKGEQGKFNPLVKARFWLVSNNTIMATDPYYYPLYKIKKEYYHNRPDLLAIKEQKPKGWNAKTDSMAKRFLIKLITSHAFDLMSNTQSASAHRNPLPIKPEDPSQFDAIHKRFTDNHATMLERLKEVWLEGDKDKYFEFLAHMDFYK